MSKWDELEQLAKNATPGDWWIDSHGHTMVSHDDDGTTRTIFQAVDLVKPAVRHSETGNLSHWPNDWDASYIATANPKTVLTLIEQNRELLEALRAVADDRTWRTNDITLWPKISFAIRKATGEEA